MDYQTHREEMELFSDKLREVVRKRKADLINNKYIEETVDISDLSLSEEILNILCIGFSEELDSTGHVKITNLGNRKINIVIPQRKYEL